MVSFAEFMAEFATELNRAPLQEQPLVKLITPGPLWCLVVSLLPAYNLFATCSLVKNTIYEDVLKTSTGSCCKGQDGGHCCSRYVRFLRASRALFVE